MKDTHKSNRELTPLPDAHTPSVGSGDGSKHVTSFLEDGIIIKRKGNSSDPSTDYCQTVIEGNGNSSGPSTDYCQTVIDGSNTASSGPLLSVLGDINTNAMGLVPRTNKDWSEAESSRLFAERRRLEACSWKDFHEYWTEEIVCNERFPARTQGALSCRYNILKRSKCAEVTPSRVISEQAILECTGENEECGMEVSEEPNPVIKVRVPRPTLEENSDFTAFRDEFLDRFGEVCSLDMERAPLKLSSRISHEKWKWCNYLVDKYWEPADGEISIKRLNCLVYSIGMVLENAETQRLNVIHQNRAEWYKKQNQVIQKLTREKRLISLEITRRTCRITPNRTDMQRFEKIRLRFKGCRNATDLQARKEELESQVLLAQNRVKTRREAELRRQLRVSSLKKTLQGKAMPCELESADEVRNWWKPVIGVRKEFFKSDKLTQWEQSVTIEDQKFDVGHSEDLRLWNTVLKKTKSNKAPGPDGIPNVLWKKISKAGKLLFRWIITIKEGKLDIPKWLALGKVVMLPKGGDLKSPGSYRPIACLNTCYKLITGLFTQWITLHLESNEILPEAQRAISKGCWGCTHAQILDRTVARDLYIGRPKNLAIGWIDFAKAFDSVPHGYVQYLLKVLKIHKNIRNTINRMMTRWVVKYYVGIGPERKVSESLIVRNGVMQGDTLSPLLFCLAIAPISHMLNVNFHPYRTSAGKMLGTELKLTHQFYMDDLKLYAWDLESLQQMISEVEILSGHVGLRLNPSKCAMVSSTKVPETARIGEIPILGDRETYKYLGIEERFLASEKEVWDRIVPRMMGILGELLKPNLSAKRIIEGYNTMVLPIAKYYFSNIIFGAGRFDVLLLAAKKFDLNVRRVLVEGKFRYATSNTSRLYLPCKAGGVGLGSMVDTLAEGMVYTWCYIECKPELESTRALISRLSKSTKRSIESDVNLVLKEYGIMERVQTPADGGITIERSNAIKTYTNPTKAARVMMRMYKHAVKTKRLLEWETKKKAGCIPNASYIDIELSSLWIAKGRVSKINLRNIIATQEQCLNTRSLYGRNRSCRRCGIEVESVVHVVAGCSVFRNTVMLDRHNAVCREIYFQLGRKYKLGHVHFTQPIPAVTENSEVKVLYDINVVTRKVLRHNRPDIVVFDKVTKKITIIEVSVSWYSMLRKMDMVKYQKYAVNSCMEEQMVVPYPSGDNLQKEMSELHRSEYAAGAEVVPIVIGCCGEVMPSILERLESLGFAKKQLNPILERLERSAALGTSRLVKNHLAVVR